MSCIPYQIARQATLIKYSPIPHTLVSSTCTMRDHTTDDVANATDIPKRPCTCTASTNSVHSEARSRKAVRLHIGSDRERSYRMQGLSFLSVVVVAPVDTVSSDDVPSGMSPTMMRGTSRSGLEHRGL